MSKGYKSSTQGAYERLRKDLVMARFRPGERLPTHKLCEDMSVSLGAVREALSRLSSEGLVTAEPQRGFRAAAISNKELKDLSEIRADIEATCIRRSFAKGGPDWEGRVVASYRWLAKSIDSRLNGESPLQSEDVYTSAHTRFHDELVSECDSEWLLRLRSILFAQSERYRALAMPFVRKRRNPKTEHRKFMEAALAQDTEAAVSLMRSHIMGATLALLDAIGDESDLSVLSAEESSTVASEIQKIHRPVRARSAAAPNPNK